MARKNDKYQETVDAAETYSHSDDDEDYEDEEDSVTDEDEEAPFWRQHLLAIVIAIIAAFVSHIWNQSQQENSTSLLNRLEFSTQKHPHVQDYRRTANVSFCPNEKVASWSD